jgi:tetratricopeptide (TPR) repeat protein
MSRRIAILVILWCPILSLNAAEQSWEQSAREAFQQGRLEEARSLAEGALSNPAAAALAQEWLGRIALQEKHPEEAISHFQMASAKGHFSLEMAREWSAALVNLGRSQEACELLEKSVTQNPASVELRYDLGTLYMSQGMPLKARPHLEEAYRGGLKHAGVVLQLTQARFLTGGDDQAVLLLESIYDSASSPDFLLQAGKILFDHVLYLKAAVPLERAWKQKPGSYEIGMYLALSYYISGRYQACETVLSDVKNGDMPTLEYLVLRGSVLARLDKWGEAEQNLEKALQLYPDQAGAYLNLGLFYLERNQKEKATTLIEKGAQMMSKGTKILYSIRSMEKCEGLVPPQKLTNQDTARGEFYNQFGRALHDSQQNGSSLAVYLLALEEDSHNEDSYAEIGKLCWEFDSYPVAESYLQKGLELHPDSWELYFNLGLIYQSLSQAEKAVQNYTKAIALEEPRVPSIHWVQLGTAQLSVPNLGESEAERSFRKALEIDPNSAQAYYQLGKLYMQQREFGKAEQYLEKAISLDPSLFRAYYQYGIACLRNGKTEKGKEMVETFNRKRVLRTMSGSVATQSESASEKILQ